MMSYSHGLSISSAVVAMYVYANVFCNPLMMQVEDLRNKTCHLKGKRVGLINSGQ